MSWDESIFFGNGKRDARIQLNQNLSYLIFSDRLLDCWIRSESSSTCFSSGKLLNISISSGVKEDFWFCLVEFVRMISLSFEYILSGSMSWSFSFGWFLRISTPVEVIEILRLDALEPSLRTFLFVWIGFALAPPGGFNLLKMFYYLLSVNCDTWKSLSLIIAVLFNQFSWSTKAEHRQHLFWIQLGVSG